MLLCDRQKAHQLCPRRPIACLIMVLCEKTMDFVYTAIKYIESRPIISNGAKRIGLDTIWDKTWEPVWKSLETSGKLWHSFSLNDIVVREGRVEDIAAYAATDKERIEQEVEVADEVTLAHEHLRVNPAGASESDKDDEESGEDDAEPQITPFTLAGLALVPPVGAGPAVLPQFLPTVAVTGAALASATVAAAAAAAVKPSAQRKCTICDAVGHRADNQAFPACWAANKKNVAAKKADIAAAKKAASTQQ